MRSFVNKHIAEKLKHLRTKSESKDIQKVVAAKLGMKQQNYSKLENGGTNFSDKILTKICKAFNITPSEFINLQSQLPKGATIVRPNINNIDDHATRILFASFRKQIAEQKLRIAELEIAARRQKVDKVITENMRPIYVMI